MHSITPAAVELMFKALKPKPLAEVPWTFDPARDEIAGHDPGSMPQNREGIIRLFRLTSRLAALVGAAPFIMAFFDGGKRYPLRMTDIHWQIPEFQPFKAEHDAWMAAASGQAAPLRTEREEANLITPGQPEPCLSNLPGNRNHAHT